MSQHQMPDCGAAQLFWHSVSCEQLGTQTGPLVSFPVSLAPSFDASTLPASTPVPESMSSTPDVAHPKSAIGASAKRTKGSLTATSTGDATYLVIFLRTTSDLLFCRSLDNIVL